MLQALVARGTRQQVRASSRPATAGECPLDKVTWLLDQVAQVATSYNEVARAVGYSANSGAVTRRVGLLAGVCPLLAAALLGVPGNYLRLDMHEVRQLRTDAARLLHQRLHWIDAGDCREIGVDTLVGYVWPEPACSATARKRRERVREALAELEALLGCSVASPRPGIVSAH